MAEFITFEGKVYKSFDPAGPCVVHKRDKYVEYYGGIDFGFRNPTAIGVAGKTKDGTLDLVEEIYETGLVSYQVLAHVKALQNKYGVTRWWADPADPAMIEELKIAGIPISPAPRMKARLESSWVKNGIVEVEKLLIKDPPALRFFALGCPMTIKDMDNYRYPQRREGAQEKEQPLKVDDHGCDMVRYLVVGLKQYESMYKGVLII
jgi:hypothetical protein